MRRTAGDGMKKQAPANDQSTELSARDERAAALLAEVLLAAIRRRPR